MKERAALVWEQGSFLAKRYEKDYPVELYYMGSFFAEVWYTPKYHSTSIFGFFIKHTYLTSVRAFQNKLNLEPYLVLINLPEV